MKSAWKWLRRFWSRRPSEVRMPACSSAMLIPEVAEKLTGSQVDAITACGVTFFFRGADDERLRRHERKHREQQKREGAAFHENYLCEHVAKGYQGNKYEIEARAAEEEAT